MHIISVKSGQQQYKVILANRNTTNPNPHKLQARIKYIKYKYDVFLALVACLSVAI